MSRVAYYLNRDLAEAAYCRLIDSLVAHEDWFGLVWRRLDPEAKARSVWHRLRPLEIEHRRCDRWPASQLVGGHATVIKYRASKKARQFLREPGTLFGWLHPDLPEDLFFGSERSGLAMASVSHEREAWLLRKRYAAIVGQSIKLEKVTLTGENLELVEGAV